MYSIIFVWAKPAALWRGFSPLTSLQLRIWGGIGGDVFVCSSSILLSITAWWMLLMSPRMWGTYSRNRFTLGWLATSFRSLFPCPSNTTLINLSISLSWIQIRMFEGLMTKTTLSEQLRKSYQSVLGELNYQWTRVNSSGKLPFVLYARFLEYSYWIFAKSSLFG